MDAFFAASRDGNFDALLGCSTPTSNCGSTAASCAQKLRSCDTAPTPWPHTRRPTKLYPFVRPALVNGAAGAVVAPRGRVVSVMAFTVANGRISRIDALLDPARLAQLDLTFPATADESH